MKVEIVKADITTLQVDAIVNAANNALSSGGGVDGAIHRAAGAALTAYCAQLGCCKTGEAKITPGFDLPARYIIHTVAPAWNNGTAAEAKLLANCYLNSLQLAVEYGVNSIAFPCIGTGAYRFPFEQAASIALESIAAFNAKKGCINLVLLVVYNNRDLSHYIRVLKRREYAVNNTFPAGGPART